MLYTLHRAQASIVSDIFSWQIEIAIRIAYGFCGLVGEAIGMAKRAEEQNLARGRVLQQLIKTKFVVA